MHNQDRVPLFRNNPNRNSQWPTITCKLLHSCCLRRWCCVSALPPARRGLDHLEIRQQRRRFGDKLDRRWRIIYYIRVRWHWRRRVRGPADEIEWNVLWCEGQGRWQLERDLQASDTHVMTRRRECDHVVVGCGGESKRLVVIEWQIKPSIVKAGDTKDRSRRDSSRGGEI